MLFKEIIDCETHTKPIHTLWSKCRFHIVKEGCTVALRDEVQREKERGVEIWDCDKINKQAIPYLVYATIIHPKNMVI